MTSRNRRADEELSAYLDNEAHDPEAVAARLRDDPRAARRYDELARLSHAVRRLERSAVHPAFTTRVLARTREARPLAPVAWSIRLIPFAALAIVGVLALTVYLGARPEPAPPATAWRGINPAQLDRAIEARLVEEGPGRGADFWAAPADSAARPAPDRPGADLPLEDAWLFALEDALDEQASLDGLLQSLDASETQALAELLAEPQGA
jgi:hypothetical protein